MPTRRSFLLASAAAALPLRAAARWPFPTLDGRPPLVIAHRGASGHFPEHTLAAYQRAIELGADFIEPDLVVTRDGELIARHENELSLSTDVARRENFAARRRTQTIDGRAVTGWFSEDFTLEEIRTLRATERFARERPHNAALDGKLPIVTLAEILALLAQARRQTGRAIGIYPELKQPSHFAAIGLPIEPRLAKALRGVDLPVFVQSFEPDSLRRFAAISELPRVALIGKPVEREALRELREVAQAIGAAKSVVLARDASGNPGEPTSFVADAHSLGLAVHVWTFRAEAGFLPPALRGQPQREIEAYLKAGADGVFADQPEVAIAARAALAPGAPAK